MSHAKEHVGAEGHGGDAEDSESDDAEGRGGRPKHCDADDADPLIVGDFYAAPPPRGFGRHGRASASSLSSAGSGSDAAPPAAAGRKRRRRLPGAAAEDDFGAAGGAASAGGAAAGASRAAAASAPGPRQASHPAEVPESALAKSPVPAEGPRNLWELLSCVLNVGRRRKTDARRVNAITTVPSSPQRSARGTHTRVVLCWAFSWAKTWAT